MLTPPPEALQSAIGTPRKLWLLILLFFGSLCLVLLSPWLSLMVFPPQLLTDPFLQFPTANSVQVVWFTEFAGIQHRVEYGENGENVVGATTTKLSRTREDRRSRFGSQTEDGTVYPNPIVREIWRHEAEITGLTPGVRVPYWVTSVREDQVEIKGDRFTLAANPEPGTDLKILLTSDHQLMPMTAANLQKVVETVGRVDAVFHAGDLINIPDRASEWFDDNRGNAFFPVLQGRAQYNFKSESGEQVHTGGEIIQHAPLFPTVGNHEVMGRFSTEKDLYEQFIDAFPREIAHRLYEEKIEEINPEASPVLRDRWLIDNSFNTTTFNEIFNLPNAEGKNYYAVSFGDVRLVVLYITNIWRNPNLGPKTKGRYRERADHLTQPEKWGYGQHIFEPITPGSPQYQWLEQELASSDFTEAKYKIVMFHHPPHSLGGNVVPPYTNPVQRLESDGIGRIAVRYEYPQDQDYIIRDVLPLLESAGVQLVFYGHSHLWNRFVSPSGMHFLETSNVGNSYGAHDENNPREVPEDYQETYIATGDPNGLDPVIPTLAPLLDDQGQPLPYIASNDISAFSIFETNTGIVSSYRFDARNPSAPVVKFDEFKLK
ncbi:metallophosphoesterase family protein [Oscillatoria sp. HE19RPO]|uniref:metallophosphoesterase family protein n=1 Tax=Oscillatoria sp. HE19RPO TaxID=2954806 RepID=UPI0035C8575F